MTHCSVSTDNRTLPIFLGWSSYTTDVRTLDHNFIGELLLMKKPLTFLLSLTFLFLFCATVFITVSCAKKMGNAQAAETADEKGDYKTAIMPKEERFNLSHPSQQEKSDLAREKEYFSKNRKDPLSAEDSRPIKFANDFNIPSNFKDSPEQWKILAEQGLALAQSILGLMYAEGRGVPQDDQEAVKWFRLAAEQGNALAQNNLGMMYYKGKGVPQDYKEALKWFRLAAEQGNALAQNNLGMMYYKGKGVPQDYKEALKWFRLAAEQGVAKGQFILGSMYDNGAGVPQDYVSAHMWFNLAGSNGDKDAIKRRNTVEKLMSRTQIKKAQEMARDWKPSNK